MDYSYSPVSPYGKAYEGHRTYVSHNASPVNSAKAWLKYLGGKESKYLHVSLLTAAIIVLIFAIFTTYVYQRDFTADELNTSHWDKAANYISWTKENKWFVILLWVILILLVVPSGVGLCLRKSILNSDE